MIVNPEHAHIRQLDAKGLAASKCGSSVQLGHKDA